VQLVLSSTRDIPFDAARARLEGLISQVGPADLSFSNAEIAEFLGAGLRQRIGAPGVEAITRQTEGWPAAIRMMQIILEEAQQPLQVLQAFSGSDEALAQLLNRQVLSGFPPKVREFLLCLAQLRTFSADLCAAAIDAKSAQRHLAYLIERNVFVIPLDRNRSWYRLHGLFRDHLLHEAETGLPAQRRQEILARAVQWCEASGYWREAMDYALQSGSTVTACAILERISARFVRDLGDVQQYIRWVEKLHALGAELSPEAEYWFIWALAFHRHYDHARQRMASLSTRVKRRGRTAATGPERDLHRRIEILRTSIDSLTDHVEDAYEGAAKWLAGAAEGDDPFNQAAAHCIECCYFTNMLDFPRAHETIGSARETASRTHSIYVEGWVWSYAALAAIAEGDYATMYPQLVGALAATRAALGDDAGICGTMALVAARCATGMGLDAEAGQLVEFGLKTARAHGFLEAAAAGLEAAVMLWPGDAAGPHSPVVLREVARAYPSRLSLMLSCWVCRRLVQLGRLDEAAAEAERAGLDADTRSRKAAWPVGIAALESLVAAVRIELLIAQGRDTQAGRLIAREMRKAKSTSHDARLVELELDCAALAARKEDYGLSVRHVTRAIRLAALRRIVRPFADHADTIAGVTGKAKVSAWGFALEEERRFFVEACRMVAAGGQVSEAPVVAVHDQARLLAPLTPRELELLGFIHAGLSNQQLADRTDVSITTVKWHLQNLYEKLGVGSRSAALARARVLNIPLGRGT
jgi:LuxR family maltose regulon positive regulatory protein